MSFKNFIYQLEKNLGDSCPLPCNKLLRHWYSFSSIFVVCINVPELLNMLVLLIGTLRTVTVTLHWNLLCITITNYWHSRCSWLRLLSSIFSIELFYPKQRWRMVENLKQEKRQRRRSTHDVTESTSTFSRRGLGLTLSHWWQVLWILRSFKKLGKITQIARSNTETLTSKTKPKPVCLTPSPFSLLKVPNNDLGDQ